MSVQEMREQFEAAFVEEQVRLCGEGFRSSAVYMIDQDMVTVRTAWWAWKASRRAVLVCLPGKPYASQGFVQPSFNDAIDQCRAAILDQGLSVLG